MYSLECRVHSSGSRMDSLGSWGLRGGGVGVHCPEFRGAADIAGRLCVPSLEFMFRGLQL